MTRVVYILIAVVVALVVVLAVVLLSVISSKIEIDDYVVQIWQPGAVNGKPEALLAFGVVVDDGNHVLTVLDYEGSTPDKLLVISPEYGQFDASIQAIDYRTSATLLQLQNANLPPTEIGDTSSMASNQSQRVYIRGRVAGTNRYRKWSSWAGIIISGNVSPLFFFMGPPEEACIKGEAIASGAVITDKDGKAIGLVGRYGSKLYMISIPAACVFPGLAVDINSALALLTDTSHTIGPAVSVILTESESRHIVPGNDLSVIDTENLATNITGLLDELGEPLSLDDLAQYSSGLPRFFHPEEGVILVAAFTYPVELHDSDNNLLATTKWIGIQWDRSEGKPNRLIYGSTAYVVEGAYSIEGDISGLVQLLEPIL